MLSCYLTVGLNYAASMHQLMFTKLQFNTCLLSESVCIEIHIYSYKYQNEIRIYHFTLILIYLNISIICDNVDPYLIYLNISIISDNVGIYPIYLMFAFTPYNYTLISPLYVIMLALTPFISISPSQNSANIAKYIIIQIHAIWKDIY